MKVLTNSCKKFTTTAPSANGVQIVSQSCLKTLLFFSSASEGQSTARIKGSRQMTVSKHYTRPCKSLLTRSDFR